MPKGLDVRPTPDLVKQAIFNSLGERVVNARVLELFAGTGALSLECLSRGAARAVCVEKARRHAQAIQHNLAASFPAGSLEVRVQDVFAVLPQFAAAAIRFDLILADPPYGEKNTGQRSRSLAQRLLDDSHLPQLLNSGGIFVLGHAKRDTAWKFPTDWNEIKMLKHGDSIMRFLTQRSSTRLIRARSVLSPAGAAFMPIFNVRAHRNASEFIPNPPRLEPS